jgi:hypothetical protein
MELRRADGRHFSSPDNEGFNDDPAAKFWRPRKARRLGENPRRSVRYCGIQVEQLLEQFPDFAMRRPSDIARAPDLTLP